MATSFSIAGTSYDALARTIGRKALFIRVAAPIENIKRFHVPGVDGNYVVRGGQAGGNIMCAMRYINVKATALLDYRTDRELFAGQSNTIVDDEGRTYSSCNLIGMAIETEPQGLIVVGQASPIWFDVTAAFIVDGGPST